MVKYRVLRGSFSYHVWSYIEDIKEYETFLYNKNKRYIGSVDLDSGYISLGPSVEYSEDIILSIKAAVAKKILQDKDISP